MDKVKQETQMTVQMRLRQGQIVASSTRGIKVGYLPGGMKIVTRGRMTGRIAKQRVDEMGRFTWIMLNGKNRKQVMIISAYRVCKSGENIGPRMAHMQ